MVTNGASFMRGLVVHFPLQVWGGSNRLKGLPTTQRLLASYVKLTLSLDYKKSL
jgi:hypothetical protein